MKLGILAVSLTLFGLAATFESRPAAPGTAPQGKTGIPVPPPGQGKSLPPVLEPARGPVERRDLLQRFKPRHPIEGFYRLKAMAARDGGFVAGCRGYLFLGQRHMSLQLHAPAANPRQKNIQAAVRSYRIAGNRLVMSSLLGHRNKHNGDIALDKAGESSEYRFQRIGSALRIHLNSSEYLEFQRLE